MKSDAPASSAPHNAFDSLLERSSSSAKDEEQQDDGSEEEESESNSI